MPTLRLDIWSDIACPWCYVGKRRLEQALAGFAHAADTEIIWHAFELDPRAPRVRTGTQRNVERLAAKYRVTPAQAQQMIDRLIETGAGAGLDLRLHDSRGGNTFDGHRLLHWALDEGGPAAQGALKERLLRAYHTEAAAIGEPEVLAALADDVGLAGAAAILATSRYADSVRADEATARDLGVTGVPFFVLAGRMAIAGAQPASLMAGSLARAWAMLAEHEPAAPDAASAPADGAACGPDGCDDADAPAQP